jgi:hypothetical protein
MSRSVLRGVTTSVTPNVIDLTKSQAIFFHPPNNANTPGGLANLSAPNGGYRRLEGAGRGIWGEEMRWVTR